MFSSCFNHLTRHLREGFKKKNFQILDIVQISETPPPSSLDTKSLDTREVVRPPPLPPKSLDTKSLKVYIRSASCVDKVLIVVVYERLEVSINVTIMISTIGMVHELPFYITIQTFFTQTFLDKDLWPPPLGQVSKLFSKKKLGPVANPPPLFGQCPKFGSFFFEDFPY